MDIKKQKVGLKMMQCKSIIGVDKTKKGSTIDTVFNNKEVIMRSVEPTNYFRITGEKEEMYYFVASFYIYKTFIRGLK